MPSLEGLQSLFIASGPCIVTEFQKVLLSLCQNIRIVHRVAKFIMEFMEGLEVSLPILRAKIILRSCEILEVIKHDVTGRLTRQLVTE